MGADDYLTKPFSLLVLKARMDALKRAGFDGNEKRIMRQTGVDKATKRPFWETKYWT